MSDKLSSVGWIQNPDYGKSSFTVELWCGDRILVAVPLHEDSSGGFGYQVITPTETGFDDADGDSWSEWSWGDVEFYCVISKPKAGD